MLNPRPIHCQDAPRELVLASASPRRQDLLNLLGLRFQVDPSSVPEIIRPTAELGSLVREFARAKAKATAARHENALIIAADTLVGVENQIFGKPRDNADA